MIYYTTPQMEENQYVREGVIIYLQALSERGLDSNKKY